MRMPRRFLRYFGIGVAAGFVVSILAILILSRTPFGIEQVRRIALRQVEQRIHGELSIGRVSARTLLGGMTLHDVAIADSTGRHFLRADSVRAAYDWRLLLRGRLVFSRAWFYSPHVVLEKLPGDDHWNFQHIFAAPARPVAVEREARMIRLGDVRISRGTVVLRTAWTPSLPVEPRDTARLILEPVPGGVARVTRFDNVSARFPEVIVSTPDEAGMLFRVASLAMVGRIWREPFELRDMRGLITLRDSLLTFEATRALLPESQLTAVGSIVFSDDAPRTDIRIEGERVALRDLNWLYPPLPEEGSGSLVLRIQSLPAGTLWLATDAHIRAPGTELAGSFGIVTGDTLYFTQVDLRASPLNLRLLEDIIGDRMPVDGLLVGTVEVTGPLSSLTGRGDLRLTPYGHATASAAVRWDGTVDATNGLGATALRTEIVTLDLGLLAAWLPELEGAGRVAGRVEANGSRGDLRFDGHLQHTVEDGEPSLVRGALRVRPTPQGMAVAARVHAEPIRLEELAKRLPQFGGLSGELRGPIDVSGGLRQLSVEAALATPSGQLVFAGGLDRRGEQLAYRAEGRLDAFRLSDYLADLATTDVTGSFSLQGRGTDPGRAHAEARLALEGGRIGEVEISRGVFLATLDGGILRVDSLLVLSPRGGELRGEGSIALAGEQVRSLRVDVRGERLQSLLSLLPMADDADSALRRMNGEVELEATLAGTARSWTAVGAGRFAGVTLDPITLATAQVDFAVRGLGSDSAGAEVRFRGADMVLGEQTLTRVDTDIDFFDRGGTFTASALGIDRRDLAVAGRFHRDEDRYEITLRELALRSGEGFWTLAEETALRLGDGGLGLDRLVLDRAGGGVLEMAGRLHWNEEFRPDDALTHEPIRFHVAVRDLPLAEALRIPLRESPLDGTITGELEIHGTTAEPLMSSSLRVSGFRYDDLHLDRVEIETSYAQRAITASFSMHGGSQRVLVGAGTIPLELAFGPVPDRHRAEPIAFTIRADSLPAALPAALLDDLRAVEGWITGAIEVGGTTRDPVLGGRLALHRGATTLQANAVRYRDIEGEFELLDNRVVTVAATLRSNGGRSRIGGAVTFAELGDPTFDLTLLANDLQASRRRDVELTTTGEVRLTGRYTRPVLAGGVRVDRGALYLDELARQVQIVELDNPLLFDVVDTSLVSVRKFMRTSSNPFMQNLVISTTLNVGRDFWLRSRDMNVELTGGLTVEFDHRAQDLRLTGMLTAVRGIYQLYGRRFEVRDGTVEFFGTPGIDPLLNITALYRVRLPDAAPLDIRAHLTGTLQAPRVNLTSESDAAISQSDLASYLLFGRPTYELAPAESRALQLASHGLRLGTELLVPTVFGYAAAELEQVASGFGVDYVAITSAEIRGVAPEAQNGAFGSLLGSARDFLSGTKVEVGRYVSENVFIGVSQRMAVGTSPGLRLEWRFHPTWTGELFWEDRFARLPGLHDSQIFDRKVGGFFLFREWGF